MNSWTDVKNCSHWMTQPSENEKKYSRTILQINCIILCFYFSIVGYISWTEIYFRPHSIDYFVKIVNLDEKMIFLLLFLIVNGNCQRVFQKYKIRWNQVICNYKLFFYHLKHHHHCVYQLHLLHFLEHLVHKWQISVTNRDTKNSKILMTYIRQMKMMWYFCARIRK